LSGSARIASLWGPRVPIIEAILFNAKMERAIYYPPISELRWKGLSDRSVWKNDPYMVRMKPVTDLRMCCLPVWPRSWRI